MSVKKDFNISASPSGCNVVWRNLKHHCISRLVGTGSTACELGGSYFFYKYATPNGVATEAFASPGAKFQFPSLEHDEVGRNPEFIRGRVHSD